MAGRLRDRVVMVTGAGSGIGRATAVKIAGEGAAVIVFDINAEHAHATAKLIAEQSGRAIATPGNVSSAADCQAAIEAALSNFGKLDGAFNNAGILGVSAKVAEIREEDWDAIIDVNLKGVFQCMRHQIPAMLESGGGSIVNTSSVSGLSGTATLSGYSASKHAILGLTKSAAIEYSALGVRINAVCPGITLTAMADKVTPTMMEAILRSHPIGRPAEAGEIASAVAFLLSDEASYVTGHALCVDGGKTA